MRKFSLAIVLVCLLGGTSTLRGCGASSGGTGSQPATPNVIHLYANQEDDNLDYPYDISFNPFEGSFHGEMTVGQVGSTGTVTSVDLSTGGSVWYSGNFYATASAANAVLPAKWHFKTTYGLCSQAYAPEKLVGPGGIYFYTCPIYISGGAPVGTQNPRGVGADDAGDETVDANNIGEQLDENTQFMFAGDGLLSQNGQYTLLYLNDGNLVEFDASYTALWMSWTNGTGGGNAHTHLQDGNLVIYDSNTNPVFSTNTGNNYGAYLVCQNDGNIVIYDAGGTPLWATGIP